MTRPRFYRPLVVTVFVLALAPTRVATAQDWTHPMLAHGQQPSHGYFSAAPWEKVDMASGNVILTIPGLTLHGANGMDFQFVAVANTVSESGNMTWSFGVPGPSAIAFGHGVSNNPVVLATDGGRQVTHAAGAGRYRTQSWDQLEFSGSWNNDATLRRPDGVVYTFHRYSWTWCQGAGGWFRCGDYVVMTTRDPYGNGLDYVRTIEGALTGFVQHVGGQTRTITLTHETSALVVTWAGEDVPARTWRYVFHPTMGWLTEIVPPTGPGWHFEYPTSSAVRVITPNGGAVTYQLQLQYGPNQPYAPHQPIYHTWRLLTRTVAGVSGSWTFAFQDLGEGNVDASVTLPTLDRREYTHARLEGGAYAERLLLTVVAVKHATGYLEVITNTWRPSLHAVGEPVQVCPDLGDPQTWYQEDAAPMLIGAVTTARGGAFFTTTYAYCDESDQPACSNVGDPLYTTNALDYGNPTFVRETSTVTAAEWVTRYTYRDDFGAFYIRGRVASQTLQSGSESYTRGAEYDEHGFRLSETVLGATTTFARDAYGQGQSVTDANGHMTSFSSAWGALANTETPEFPITRTIKPDGNAWFVTQNGATTALEYDALGRPTRLLPPVGNDTRTTYAEDGTWVQVARGASWTRTDLDGFGRAVGTVNSQGVHTATEYDELGHTTGVRAPYDSAHPEERWTRFAYDALDRMTEKHNPDDSTVTYDYTFVSTEEFTGLQTTITDENLHVTRQRWQAVGTPGQGWLRAVIDAAGQTTSYEYNALGSLTKVTLPGAVRTWTYNTKNQLASQTQPEFGVQGQPEPGTMTYTYDAVGNLASQTDAKNQTTSYEYDGNNRLTLVTSPDAMYSTTIGYDAANNRTSVSNGYVSTTFDYDEANRLIRRTDALNNRTFVSAYTVDDNGNVVDVQYPSGNHVEYGYDSENRATSVADPARGLTFASAITYHPAAGLAGYTSGDGAAHTISYDARQRPAHIGASGVANLPALTYGYDDAGNVLSIGDPREGYGATFGYDALDRLKTATGGGWDRVEYWYDALGNREQQTHGTVTTHYTYTDHQRIRITGETARQYDPNGNQTQDGIGAYEYTPTNMLETVRPVAGGLHLYHYDGDGQRALKRQGSTKTTTYLRGLGQVLSEFEEESQQLRWSLDQVYLGSQLLAATRPPAGTTVLTIGKAGAGTGTVTSTPDGIGCDGACTTNAHAFAAGLRVTLTATADPGWVFVGWSGDLDCTDGVVTLTDPTTCVATFALTAPLFAKQAPLNGGSTGTRRVTLQWSAAPNASYEVCWDTTDNGVCDTAWHWNATATRRVVEFATNGTYFWQVRTFSASPTEADDGAWWSVTVTGPPLFTKITPGHGAGGLGTTVTLQWTPVPNEGYAVCWDTSNNTTCDNAWWPNGGGTARVLEGLSAGTYYWQVKTAGGAVLADNGAWHAFTVATAALFSKQAPGNGATGLGSTVTLQWTAVPDEGYWVCWDTSDNGSCDSAWWPNGGATARVLEGLSAGTYYWQVKTAGGGVPADNGTWHHFTVAAEPLAMSTAGASGAGTPGLANAEPRVAGGVYAAGVAGAAGLTLAVLLAGPRRRRRVLAAGVMVFVLAPAAALAQTTTQVVEYYTTDALGSVRAVTKRVNGVLHVTRHDFMPFGEEVAPPTASQDKRLFTGKERDAETGMDYFGARYYRASVGRFTSTDPIVTLEENFADPQRWNRYAYVRNNPLRFADPDGREIVCAGPGCEQARAQAANTAVVMASGAAKGAANGAIGLVNTLNFLVDSALAFTPFRIGQIEPLPMTSTERVGALVADTVLAVMTVGGALLAENAAAPLGRVGTAAIVDESGLTARGDITLAGGRSGQRVKGLTGPPNSAVKGSGELPRVFVTDEHGRVVLDIRSDRVKPVTPGRGFGDKRPPTQDELALIDRVHGKGGQQP